MPIIRKPTLKHFLTEYDERSLKLRHVLSGGVPNGNIWNLHSQNPDDFTRDFSEFDEEKLSTAIDELKVNLEKLKKLKKHREPPLGSAR